MEATGGYVPKELGQSVPKRRRIKWYSFTEFCAAEEDKPYRLNNFLNLPTVSSTFFLSNGQPSACFLIARKIRCYL